MDKITNVGELVKVLSSDTAINPFGSPNTKLVYDQEKNDDFSFLDSINEEE